MMTFPYIMEHNPNVPVTTNQFTLWWTNIAIENGPVEIVGFPSYKMGGSFHCYVTVHQFIYHLGKL